MATRPVRFCGICGGRVHPLSRTYGLPIAYCRAHDRVPALDAIPPDPLTCLPMQSEELREQPGVHHAGPVPPPARGQGA